MVHFGSGIKALYDGVASKAAEVEKSLRNEVNITLEYIS